MNSPFVKLKDGTIINLYLVTNILRNVEDGPLDINFAGGSTLKLEGAEARELAGFIYGIAESPSAGEEKDTLAEPGVAYSPADRFSGL